MNSWFRNTILIVCLLKVCAVNAQQFRWNNPPLKIVVLGSSTAAGYGVSDRDSAWVNQYDAYLKTFHPENEAINLAVGGYNTYHIMPDDFDPPTRRRKCDSLRNISQAISLGCDGIIVNLPSNDVANGYSTKEQLDNFRTVAKLAEVKDIPIWICTVQPRNFRRHRQRNQQAVINDSIREIFANNHIDFWTGFATESHGVVSNFDSGDGCHLNDDGHRLLTDRVIKSGAFDSLLICSGEQEEVKAKEESHYYNVELEIAGKVQMDTDELNKEVKISIVQNNLVIASIQQVDSSYSILSKIDKRTPIHLIYSAENYLSQTLILDLKLLNSEKNTRNNKPYFSFSSVNMKMIPLSWLNSDQSIVEINICKYKMINEGDYQFVISDDDYCRKQFEKLEYLTDSIRSRKVIRYNSNGSIKTKLKYRKGHLHGTCTWYNIIGFKKIKARFRNGEYDGNYFTYNSKGKKNQKLVYQNGIVIEL